MKLFKLFFVIIIIICAAYNFPLLALENNPPLVNIASGTYSNLSSHNFPLIAATNDGGNTWFYPPAVFRNLQNSIDPNFVLGLLPVASCTGLNDKSVCIAAGDYCTDTSCVNDFPLVAVGNMHATKWSYPASIYKKLTTSIDPHFLKGNFAGASCTGSGGNAICIATGSYFTEVTQLPLVGISVNAGDTWSYPAEIFQNLSTSIDPDFFSGYFAGASCTGSNTNTLCTAAGAYCTDLFCNSILPLVAVTNTPSRNWFYPKSVFQNLKTVLDSNFVNGSLSSTSCTTGTTYSGICIAVGEYFTDSTTLPLLTQSIDRGNTWSYPPDIINNLTTKINSRFLGGFFLSSSCTGAGTNPLCVAAGTFFTSTSEFPWIALTRNGGSTWTYPPFIFRNLTTSIAPDFKRGFFNSVSCTGSGKTALCIAVGGYCPDKFCNTGFPLLAISKDKGHSWTYPHSIYQHVTTTIDPDFIRGFFNSASCTGRDNNSICIASGQFSTGGSELPLIVLSIDGGNTWTYPTDVFQNLKTKIEPGFLNGAFFGAATSGSKFKKFQHNKYLPLRPINQFFK